MSQLFQPVQIGQLQLDNRIIVAPMCQYSASDGTPGDWHMIHLGSLSMSGAGPPGESASTASTSVSR